MGSAHIWYRFRQVPTKLLMVGEGNRAQYGRLRESRDKESKTLLEFGEKPFKHCIKNWDENVLTGAKGGVAMHLTPHRREGWQRAALLIGVAWMPWTGLIWSLGVFGFGPQSLLRTTVFFSSGILLALIFALFGKWVLGGFLVETAREPDLTPPPVPRPPLPARR